ncbi:hypothetical protein BDF22DRAFT_652980 [Syncephalis plumigaleata]|nr:hypothetical protein BDF22DRAFT_652980 [Syncephalis plumigaleata]
MAIVLPKEFAYVALAASTTILVYTGLGWSVTSARKKYKVHYPDMGSGIYAQKLDLLLLSGLYYPTTVAPIGFLYSIARVIYAKGYQSKGPNGRLVGALISTLSMLSLLTLAVTGSLKTVGVL